VSPSGNGQNQPISAGGRGIGRQTVGVASSHDNPGERTTNGVLYDLDGDGKLNVYPIDETLRELATCSWRSTQQAAFREPYPSVPPQDITSRKVRVNQRKDDALKRV